MSNPTSSSRPDGVQHFTILPGNWDGQYRQLNRPIHVKDSENWTKRAQQQREVARLFNKMADASDSNVLIDALRDAATYRNLRAVQAERFALEGTSSPIPLALPAEDVVGYAESKADDDLKT